MSTPLRTVAVVLAGGTGSRVGLNIPKQLLKVAGKTILEHTLDVFQDAPEIDDIVLLMAAPTSTRPAELAAPYSKISTVEAGGSTRNETRTPPDRAQRPRRGGLLGAVPRRGAAAAGPPHHHRVRRRPRPLRRGGRRDPLRRHDHRRGRARGDHRRSRPQPPPSRPDPAGVPPVHHPPRLRAGLAGPGLHRDRRLQRRPALPPGRAHRRGARVRAEHEGHAADRHLPGRQALPARQLAPRRRPTPPAYQTALAGKSVVVLGGSYGIGADIAELVASFGGTVYTFSRSSTGTHVERAEDVEAALRTRLRGQRPDRLRHRHRGRAAPRAAGRHPDRGDRGGDPGQLHGAGGRRAGRAALPAGDQGPAAALHLAAPTPAAAPTTRSTPRPRPPWST